MIRYIFLVSLTLSAQSDIVAETSSKSLPSITCDHSDDNNHDSSSSKNNMHKEEKKMKVQSINKNLSKHFARVVQRLFYFTNKIL